MGTYYGLGVIKEFSAISSGDMSPEDWRELLGERLDPALFDFSLDPRTAKGAMKEGLFAGNIKDFIGKLTTMIGNEDAAFYFGKYGTNLGGYPTARAKMRLSGKRSESVSLSIVFILLFIEGKVVAEQFSSEPMLVNWLFRHAPIGNPLAGAIVTDIVG